jgi:type 1 glutamine amidotransferase
MQFLRRRTAIKQLSLFGFAGAVGKILLPGTAEAKNKRETAFALIGDRWHNFDYIRTAFKKTYVDELGITVHFTAETTDLSKENLKGHKLLIMLCDGLSFPDGYTTPYVFYDPEKMKIISDPPVKTDEKTKMWMTEEQGKTIKEFVQNGGGALFYHNASYISGDNKDFRDVEGALFTGHTAFRPYKMKIVNKEHPITKDIKDFIVTEEQHYLIYDKDKKDVLSISVNEEGLEYTGSKGNQGSTCESCWAYDYGKGRVCFMAPGHTIPSLWNPEYVKLQKNAVKWLLREI